MAYTSPTKVAQIVEQKQQGWSHQDIAKSIHIHHTTISRILNWFEKSHNYYHINPKTGHPHKMDLHESHIATWMIAQIEAANATEVQKKAFPTVSIRTVQRHPKEQGLQYHIRKSKPYLSKVNKEKWRLWAMQHIKWTVDDWKRVIFSDKSIHVIQVRWMSILLY
jgi:transposase